jgi:hypothetical protein
MNRKDDLDILKEGKPFILGILAFLVYLRFGSTKSVDNCYAVADKFIRKLETDLE